MDAIEAIFTRRSVRKYLPKPVPEEIVRKLLAAAMQAPSARNQQPWQFVVIDDCSILIKIAELMPTAAMASKAPLAILVCGDLDLEKSLGYLSGVGSCFARSVDLIGIVKIRVRYA